MRRAAAIALLSTGCSFGLVSGPPPNHRELPAFDCTALPIAPIIDAAITGTQLLNLASAAIVTDEQWAEPYDGEPPYSRTTAFVLYGSLATIGAAAALYGFMGVRSCRRAKRELATRARAPHHVPHAPYVPTDPGIWPPLKLAPPAVEPAPETPPSAVPPAEPSTAPLTPAS